MLRDRDRDGNCDFELPPPLLQFVNEHPGGGKVIRVQRQIIKLWLPQILSCRAGKAMGMVL